jgi:hypothetical protein
MSGLPVWTILATLAALAFWYGPENLKIILLLCLLTIVAMMAAYVNELRPTLLTNVGSPWLQWRLVTDAARPSQPARPFGAVQKAARRPCLVANTLIMGQRLAWPGCV